MSASRCFIVVLAWEIRHRAFCASVDAAQGCWVGRFAGLRDLCCSFPRVASFAECFGEGVVGVSYELCCLGDAVDFAPHVSKHSVARLRHYAALGFNPQNVLDVGANYGGWSTVLKEVFPQAQFFLVEANPAVEDLLRDTGFPYEIAVLTSQRGPVDFFAEVGGGSDHGASLFQERSQEAGVGAIHREAVRLRGVRLDDLVVKRRWPTRFDLLKLDVQGAEMQVLAGARKVLRNAQLVLLECSLLPFNRGAPVFHEVVAFMAFRGFRVVDVTDVVLQAADRRAMQVDILFAQQNSSWAMLQFPFPASRG